ncbi:MAG: dihydropteroate synthase, partial [Chitinophagales bacterium]
MGIINVTPDSFYPGSRFTRQDEILNQADKMLREGADILDIGGQSTRPGAQRISISEELDRISGTVQLIHEHFPVARISIDTFYAKVAIAAVAAGAVIINDISAGAMDEEMLPAVASMRTPFVCMHMRGEPATMQKNPVYQHLVLELLDFFIARTSAIRKAGIQDIIIDPGFG